MFGRGPECHVRPNSELVQPAALHAAVGKESATIRDLGSVNGTLVNGSRVREAQILHDGDRIQLGPLVLLVKVPRTELKMDTVADGVLFDSSLFGDTLQDPAMAAVARPTQQAESPF